MAKITFFYLNGQKRDFGPGVRVSKYKNHYHIWREGKHIPGTKPMFSVAYAELHAVARTGQKGIEITNNYGQKIKKQGGTYVPRT